MEHQPRVIKPKPILRQCDPPVFAPLFDWPLRSPCKLIVPSACCRDWPAKPTLIDLQLVLHQFLQQHVWLLCVSGLGYLVSLQPRERRQSTLQRVVAFPKGRGHQQQYEPSASSLGQEISMPGFHFPRRA